MLSFGVDLNEDENDFKNIFGTFNEICLFNQMIDKNNTLAIRYLSEIGTNSRDIIGLMELNRTTIFKITTRRKCR